MSSPEKFPLPFKPLNATNSWVIQRARELISSDAYAIEQCLNDVTEDDDNGDNSNNHENRHGQKANSSPTGDHVSIKYGHPAGELEDYDPDYTLLSPETIIRVLEAAAEIEAGYSRDNDGALLPPEYRDDVSSSSIVSSGYRYLPSDSIEEEPLLDQYQFQNLRDADLQLTIDENPATESDIVVSSPASFLGSDALLSPSSSE
ncbi:hypothetical protein F4680DRAFT_134886 [Xylaria scruposa]|nr:hypothetical protein F4680DRAFT_134886 [Xylaria scruposa]